MSERRHFRRRRVPLQRASDLRPLTGTSFESTRPAIRPTPSPTPGPFPPGPKPGPFPPRPRPGPGPGPVYPIPVPQPRPRPSPGGSSWRNLALGTGGLGLAALGLRRFFKPTVTPRFVRQPRFVRVPPRPARRPQDVQYDRDVDDWMTRQSAVHDGLRDPSVPRSMYEPGEAPVRPEGYQPESQHDEGDIVHLPDEDEAHFGDDVGHDVEVAGRNAGEQLAGEEAAGAPFDIETGFLAAAGIALSWAVGQLFNAAVGTIRRGFGNSKTTKAQVKADAIAKAQAAAALTALTNYDQALAYSDWEFQDAPPFPLTSVLGTSILEAYNKYEAWQGNQYFGSLLQLPESVISAVFGNPMATAQYIGQNWTSLGLMIQTWLTDPSIMYNDLSQLGFLPPGAANPFTDPNAKYYYPTVFSAAPWLAPAGYVKVAHPTSYQIYGSGSQAYWFDAWGVAHTGPLPPQSQWVYPCPPGLTPAEISIWYSQFPVAQTVSIVDPNNPGTTIAYAAPGLQFGNTSQGVQAYVNPLVPNRLTSLTDLPAQRWIGLFGNTSGPRLRGAPPVPSNLSKPPRMPKTKLFVNQLPTR